MADPISVTGLVLQVADLIKQLYDYVKAVKGAEKAILSIAGELSALKSIFELNVRLGPPEVISTGNDFNKMLETTKALLDELAEVVMTRSGVAQRMIQRLEWPFDYANVEKKLSKLERLKTWFLLALMVHNKLKSETLQSEMKDLTSLLQDDIATREQRERAKEHHHLLSLLSPVSPEKTHSSVCRTWRGTQTGSWFCEGPLETWLKGSAEQIVFTPVTVLTGRSGSGKTTLLSRGVEWAKSYATDHPKIHVAYFYCSYNHIASQEVRNVLGSWVAQIAATYPQILDSFDQNASGSKTISSSQLEESILQASKEIEVVLFLDALNESVEALELAEAVRRLTRESSNIKCLISTIPHCTTVKKGMGSSFSAIQMLQDYVLLDIKAHIRSRVSAHPVVSCIPEQKIIQTLLPKCEGMFRWVDCQLSFLESQLTPRSAQNALQTLPGSLDDSYAAILLRIPASQRAIVKEILIWLSFCNRPLLLQELCEAVIIEEECETIDDSWRIKDPEQLLVLCRGLAVLDSTTGNVTLVHGSIKTFLIGDYIRSTNVSYFALEYDASIQIIIRKCLAYILMEPFTAGHLVLDDVTASIRTIFDTFPLLDYACTRWAVHASSCTLMQTELNLIRRFFETHDKPNGGNFCFWLCCLLGKDKADAVRNSEPLYYAASYGILPIVRLLLSSGLVGRWSTLR